MSLSKGRASLKATLLLLIFSLGSIGVNGALLTLQISDAHKTSGGFILTTSPTAISVPQGANGTATVTIMSIQNFGGTVFLGAQVNSTGVAVSFNPASVTISTGGSGKSVASIQAAANAAMGVYTVIITGTGLSGRRIFTGSALVAFTVDSQADFAMYANPSAITIASGFSNTTSILVKSVNGFSGSVSLYATTPFGFLGVMGGQNPLSIATGTMTSTNLQVSTTALTTLGTYNITITGVSGTLSHSTILTVIVVDPAPESLSMTGSSLQSPTGITISLHDNGNTPVTLTSYSVTDISTDSWTLGNWAGPTIIAGSTSQATILISTSCNACTYGGVAFAFQQFVAGHTYMITVTTKLNNQFTFTVIG